MAIALVVTVVLVRVAPVGLHGTDAACYAHIAQALAAKPVTDWADVRWLADEPFYEHPPLGLWLEGGWFAVFGASAASAVAWARVLALLLALFVGVLGFRLGGREGAALALVGLSSLATFQREAENPMLELPLAVACAAAFVACEALPRLGRGAVLAFAACATVAFWIKGVVAFALVGGLVWAWWRGTPRGRILVTASVSAALASFTVLAFEFARWRGGLPPFFPDYFAKHVLVAFAEGRHTVEPSPLFHVATLLDWHLPALLALPVVGLRWRATPGMRPFAVLGVAWLVCVVVPFSLAQQKSAWHLNVLMPGDALLVGAALMCLPAHVLRFTSPVLAAWMVAWVVVEYRTAAQPSARQVAVRAMATVPAPPAGSTVQNCSVLTDWPARHLFAFHWGARVVPCEGDGAWRFDGKELRRASP